MCDAVHSIRYCLSYCTFIETETYSEHCQTFKMEHSAKRCTGAEPEFFKDGGKVFVELGHFNERGPAGSRRYS